MRKALDVDVIPLQVCLWFVWCAKPDSKPIHDHSIIKSSKSKNILAVDIFTRAKEEIEFNQF